MLALHRRVSCVLSESRDQQVRPMYRGCYDNVMIYISIIRAVSSWQYNASIQHASFIIAPAMAIPIHQETCHVVNQLLEEPGYYL